MITIKNVRTLDGQTTHIQISSPIDYTLEAKSRLLMLPGVIDSHISLGSPNRENWVFAIESAVRGGVTTLVDIPSQDLPSGSKQELLEKKRLVNKRLSDLNLPLHYFMYSKGNSEYVEEMGLEKSLILGSLILLTPDHPLLDDKAWNRIFQMAAWQDLPVVINAKGENAWQEAGFKQSDETLLDKAIYYAERQNTRLYVLNVATKDELDLIQQARSKSLLVYAETTPQHLFPHNGSKADFLWDALDNGVIETIGSGYHVDAEGEERLLGRGGNFSFSNPLFLLPLLLTAYSEGKIRLENLVRATRANLYDIFNLESKDEDVVLVDLEEETVVQRVHKNSFIDMKLKGWPVYTIVNRHVFSSSKDGYHLAHVK